MTKLVSKINAKSEAFLENAQHMQQQVDDLSALVAEIAKGGNEKVVNDTKAEVNYYQEIVLMPCSTLVAPFWSFHN